MNALKKINWEKTKEIVADTIAPIAVTTVTTCVLSAFKPRNGSRITKMAYAFGSVLIGGMLIEPAVKVASDMVDETKELVESIDRSVSEGMS